MEQVQSHSVVEAWWTEREFHGFSPLVTIECGSIPVTIGEGIS
jgi:hypothetical protein